MILAYAVIAVVVGAGVWTGATRMAARSFRPLAAMVGMLLTGAGVCWLIGAQQTGSYFAGLIGTLMAMLLGLAAGCVAFGAMLRGIHDATRRTVSDPMAPMARRWDILACGALALAAVVASLLE